jgi:succinate dehydrogenase/fumarate reductase flavoprotein subunit
VDLNILKTFLPLVIFVVGALIVAVRLQSEVKELKRDMREMEKKQTYVAVVKLEAEMDQAKKNISSLWERVNNLRDRFNGK